MTPRPVRLLAALPLACAAVLLTACAPTVPMTAAPDANSPHCAEISVRLPDTVAGKPKQNTNAQATAAWGDPAVVLLRCGLSPIGPTTRPCVTADGVDWVLENEPNASVLRYITFGRAPATEIAIKHGAGGVSDAATLADLADAIKSVEQTRKCVAASDAPNPPETSTPTTG